MNQPWPLANMEVIGYADQLPSSLLPSIVSPVFQEKGGSRVFLPPYSVHHGHLCNAEERTRTEAEALADTGALTLLTPQFPAQPGHDLWLDVQGVARYEPSGEVKAHLKDFASRCLEQAVTALRRRDFPAALAASQKAVNAQDRLIEPLALAAAVARHQNQPEKEQLMREAASRLFTGATFELCLNEYSKRIGPASTAAANPVVSTVRNMALRRPTVVEELELLVA